MDFKDFLIEKETGKEKNKKTKDELKYNSEIVDKVFEFFAKSKTPPKDEEVHKLAEENDHEKWAVENIIYYILHTFLAGGEFNKSGLKMEELPKKELTMGEKVEMEHLRKESPFAVRLSQRISADHLAESGGAKSVYYTELTKMEKKLEG